MGCPKLDAVDYSEKLGAIFASNDIKSVTVVHAVPCCGGLGHAAVKALQDSKMIPWSVITISVAGSLIGRKAALKRGAS